MLSMRCARMNWASIFFLLRDVGIDREHRFGTPFVVPNERPARLDGDLTPVLGEVLEFAVPFALADRQPVDFFKFFGIGVEKSANIPANGFLARPAIHALGSLVPKQNFSFEIANEDRVLRLVQERRLFRDLLLGLFALGDSPDGRSTPPWCRDRKVPDWFPVFRG
jgi:hypothetical protein